jgi:hypothetical protein
MIPQTKSMKPGTIQELLSLEGIKTTADFRAYCKRNAKPGRSNYAMLVSKFGESNADKIMRFVEVAAWKF